MLLSCLRSRTRAGVSIEVMRLIRVDDLSLEEFLDSEVPEYAILSHTWGKNEVTFETYSEALVREKGSESKIRSACVQAANHGLSHVWIDTCCIDKRSSAELQEAINSMYRYYEKATVCFVHMADVAGTYPELRDDSPDAELVTFQNSRWFSRGWCLQELIAPRGQVEFYSASWDYIGSKSHLIQTISATTRIPATILTHSASVHSMSVAQRMSWASRRRTSRIEDQAYSLLGLFNVSLPMLYGEGSRAYIRLQEEIIRTSADHSIFAWENNTSNLSEGSLLAASPQNFEHCHKIIQQGKPGSFDMTNRGLRISLPTMKDTKGGLGETLAILNCRYTKDLSGILALRLLKYSGTEEYHIVESNVPRSYSRLAYVPVPDIDLRKPRLSPLLITREFEAQASKLKFWIPPTNGQYEIVDHQPYQLWDTNDGVMHAVSGQNVRGGVTVKTSFGHMFNVAFGFDLLSSSDGKAPTNSSAERSEFGNGDPDQSHGVSPLARDTNGDSQKAALEDDEAGEDEQSQEDYLLGIWGSTSQQQSGLKDIMRQSRPRCNHRRPDCRQHRCPFMTNSCTVYEYPRSEKLEPKIRVAKILQDTVFIISLETSPMFELETVQDAVELDATSGGSPIVAIEPTWEYVQKQKQLTLASIIPPLQHELDFVECSAPIQVWIRLPKALAPAEQPRSPFRWLSHRVLFASFDGPFLIASGFLELLTQAQTLRRVYVWFVGSSLNEWTISISEAAKEDKDDIHYNFSRAYEATSIPDSPFDESESFRVQGLMPLSRGVPLPGTGTKLCTKVRAAPTDGGVACVIDLHMEKEELDVVDFGVTNFSSVVESRMAHRDINMVENINEAMTGISDAAAGLGESEITAQTRHHASLYVTPPESPEAFRAAMAMQGSVSRPTMPNYPPPPPPT